MRPLHAVRALTLSLILCSTARVQASQIFFDGNSVNFSAPSVFKGPSPFFGDAQVTSTSPTLVPTSSGFEVQDLSYTVTATTGGRIDVSWLASRAFTGTPTTVNVAGHTDVTTSGFGPDTSVTFGVTPSVSSFDTGTGTQVISIVTGYITKITGNGTFPLSWDVTRAFIDPTFSSPVLRESGSLTWTNALPGSTITLASDYGTTVFAAAAVPEPASMWLLATGLLTLGCHARRGAARGRGKVSMPRSASFAHHEPADVKPHE